MAQGTVGAERRLRVPAGPRHRRRGPRAHRGGPLVAGPPPRGGFLAAVDLPGGDRRRPGQRAGHPRRAGSRARRRPRRGREVTACADC
ncbi:Exonuclease SbcC [Streptomyces misionensis JCM 4497]